MIDEQYRCSNVLVEFVENKPVNQPQTLHDRDTACEMLVLDLGVR